MPAAGSRERSPCCLLSQRTFSAWLQSVVVASGFPSLPRPPRLTCDRGFLSRPRIMRDTCAEPITRYTPIMHYPARLARLGASPVHLVPDGQRPASPSGTPGNRRYHAYFMQHVKLISGQSWLQSSISPAVLIPRRRAGCRAAGSRVLPCVIRSARAFALHRANRSHSSRSRVR